MSVRLATQAIALIVALLLSGGCQAGTADGPLRAGGTIVVLGDSLAVSPSQAQGFPAVLQERLRSRGVSWTVVNAGIRGDTTAGGVRRINAVLSANRPDVLILALGANDGLRKLDVEHMSANLAEIIRRAQADDTEVLLCGMELPPLNVFSYGRQFRDAFAAVAEQHDVTLVPFLLDGVAMVGDMNGPDGIHPNAAGAQRIAENIWPYLERLLAEG